MSLHGYIAEVNENGFVRSAIHIHDASTTINKIEVANINCRHTAQVGFQTHSGCTQRL